MTCHVLRVREDIALKVSHKYGLQGSPFGQTRGHLAAANKCEMFLDLRMEALERWLVVLVSLAGASWGSQAGGVVEEVLEGWVGGGNYSYFTLEQVGWADVWLESVEGDADLYVSARTDRPTFHLSGHELQAASCGLDALRLSASFPRPATLAVYGHPSAPASRFRLRLALHPPSDRGEEASDPSEPWRREPPPEEDREEAAQLGPGDPAAQAEEDEEGFAGGFWGALGSVLFFLLQIIVEVLA